MMVPLSTAQMDIQDPNLVICELCNVFTSRSLQGLSTHVAKCVKKHGVLPASGGAGGGARGKKHHPTDPEIPAPVRRRANQAMCLTCNFCHKIDFNIQCFIIFRPTSEAK